MWHTVDGLRTLNEPEARLIGRAVGALVDTLEQALDSEPACERESDDSGPAGLSGVDWFDQWDAEQRLWLLEQVTLALLLPSQPPPPHAAIFEATIDAIFCRTVTAIAEEIENEIELRIKEVSHASWRQLLAAAFHSQHDKDPSLDLEQTDLRQWHSIAFRVAESILGPSSYLQAELFRDREPKFAERFLRRRGLPADYLQRIPPLVTTLQARRTVRTLRTVIDR